MYGVKLMLELPQYEYETRLYHMVPVEHRWIFNKLQVQERLNVFCGPCGVPIWQEGTFCVRPIMSLIGCGHGGWTKHYCDGSRHSSPPYQAGYFWMPWYEGRQVWTEYINDEPVRQAGGYMDGNILRWEQSFDFIELPEPLRKFSKFMCVESIDGKVIEAAPKHLADNKDCLMDMKLGKDSHGNNLWEEMWETARPWKINNINTGE